MFKMNKPKWKYAPEWAEWLVKQPDSSWDWGSGSPKIATLQESTCDILGDYHTVEQWVGYYLQFAGEDDPSPHWRYTLEYRDNCEECDNCVRSLPCPYEKEN